MPKNTGQPMDRLPKKHAMTKTVLLANDNEFGEQYRQVTQKVRILEMRIGGQTEKNPALVEQLAEAQAELDEMEPLVEEHSIKFKFRAIGRKRFEELVTDHPPTDEQIAEAEAEKQKAIAAGDKDVSENMTIQWNYETFVPALVARCMVEPMKWTEENHDEIVEWLNGDDWNTAEIGELFQAAMSVNNSSHVLSMGKGSRKTTSSL